MTTAIVDSTVIIGLFRKNMNARTWFASQTEKLSVTVITWLEVMYGAPGKIGLAASKEWLDKFDIIHLTPSDQDWTMEHMLKYRLSRGIEINDCLIASIAHRLQLPIYTHNVVDMTKYLPQRLVVKPY